MLVLWISAWLQVQNSNGLFHATSVQVFEFLHFPKCGTQFARTLIRFGCGNLSEREYLLVVNQAHDASWDRSRKELATAERTGDCPRLKFRWSHNHANPWAHFPLPLTVSPDTSVAALFRQPTRRLKAMLTMIVLKNTSPQAFGLNISRHNILDVLEDERKWRDEVDKLGLTGCMTKMISGAGACGSSVELGSYHINKATARMLDFAFVGITDEWNTTIFLFHAMFLPNVPVRDDELEVGRAGYLTLSTSHITKFSAMIKDAADAILFAAAKRRFDEQTLAFLNTHASISSDAY